MIGDKHPYPSWLNCIGGRGGCPTKRPAELSNNIYLAGTPNITTLTFRYPTGIFHAKTVGS